MKHFLAGLCCALVASASVAGQEQQESTRPPRPARSAAVTRDHPPAAGRQITISLLIADLTEALDNPSAGDIIKIEHERKLAAATRLRWVTLDELPAHIQFGGRPASRVTGGRGGFPGPPPSSAAAAFAASTANTAVQVQATTRVEDNGSIVVQLYVERPEAAVPQKLLEADGSEQARRSFAFTAQSTIRLRSGEPIIVCGRDTGTDAERSQTWIVVAATVQPSE
jgi:hypothetical protein